jgi:glutamate---cysteine ligase / carboxylate-amine ligase
VAVHVPPLPGVSGACVDIFAAVSAAAPHDESVVLAGVRERFEASTDLTIGIEEEYQLLDPDTHALVSRYEELHAAADADLSPHLAGELISSEVEYRTSAHARFADAARDLTQGRITTGALADRLGIGLGVAGVHPFSRWPDQNIIDTEHYRRVQDELGYIAWTNNTWSLHVHVGVRGADRAVAVTSALRSVLPELLALSANSAVFWGKPTGLHSARTQVFTRSFPRCGVPDVYADWNEYADYVRLLERTGSIVESTQIWHSVRPHHSYGTVEVRICDGQTEMTHALGLAALMVACVAAFMRDYDDGRALPAHPHRLIEENFWRAERNGIGGTLIDLDTGDLRSTPAAIERLLAWSESVHGALGLDPFLASIADTLVTGNGAARQLRLMEELGNDARALQVEIARRTRLSAEEVMSTMGEVATA